MGYEEAKKVVMDMKKFGSGFIPQNMRSFNVMQTELDTVVLNFLEPKDTVIEGQHLLIIKGVVVRMKEGSYPTHKADGTLITDNTELGKYEELPLSVNGLQLGHTYYFSAFPYSENGIFNESRNVANIAEITMQGGENVTVNVSVDRAREFQDVKIVLHNVTTGEDTEQTLNGAGTISFNIGIGDEYYIEAGEVEHYQTPEETPHYVAQAGGSRTVNMGYVYLMEVITVTLRADDGSDVSSQKLICHNNTTGEEIEMAYDVDGVSFTVPHGCAYYVVATEKDFYSVPKTDIYIATKGNTRAVSLEYAYIMEKITVILSADEGGDVSGHKLICHNSTTGEETEKPYSIAGVSFMIPDGSRYYITATEMDFYTTPKSETFTAVKGNSRAVALAYEYNMEVVEVTLRADDGRNVSGQKIICHNNTTGQDTQKAYNAAGVSFMIPHGNSYYVTATPIELYATPKAGTYTAVKGNRRSVSLEYVYAPSLEDCTPAFIAEMAESGQAANIWEVGDTKEITLTTGEKIEIAIAGFNHDTLSDGSGMAGITFTMTHAMETRYNMNSSDTNVGGWTSSAMRGRMESILNTLPKEWRDVIKSVKKKTSAGNKQTTISTTDDKLFLFSEVEIFGKTSYSVAGEGSQYPYYATEANRIKKQGINGSAYSWWERSPFRGNATYFCYVLSDGAANYDGASLTRGLCAGFCV